MTLDNMRDLGVHHLVATYLNDACRHQGLVIVSADTAGAVSVYQRLR